MKNYDLQKAQQLITDNQSNLTTAYLGMHEDWFWTSDSIWEDGTYTKDLNTDILICGIGGSSWATPTIELTFKDGTVKYLSCYIGESSGERPAHFKLGVLSQQVQTTMPPLSE